MCGFAALIRISKRTNGDLGAIQRMGELLTHRGPDDSGSFADQHVALTARRLSILDLSTAGHQPFISPDGNVRLVYNGEVYNYVELRRELQSLGHVFRSTGDTEVLLHSYLQWGAECVTKLNGMFAFIVYDARRGVIFGARDRFGIKPFYRCQNGDVVAFASEIKSIFASGLVERRPNQRRVNELLRVGSMSNIDFGEETFFAGVEQLPPGSAFELYVDGRHRQWRYWSLPELGIDPVRDPVGEFGALFDDSVNLMRSSDRRVGISLSGGLDSTAIICSLATGTDDHLTRNPAGLDAFAFMTKAFDESPYIDATVQQTGAQFYPIALTGRDIWDALPRVLWYQDEPIHSATAVAGYEVYRHAAAADVAVVFCGQGADETIGGYDSFFNDLWRTLVRRGQLADAWTDIRGYTGLQGGSAILRFLSAAERVAKRQLGTFQAYRMLAHQRHARRMAEAARWFDIDPNAPVAPASTAVNTADLDAAMREAVEIAPLPLYLRIEDRNSMAHSIEARLPFLDHRLVSLAFRLPLEWRLRAGWNKYVLREAMRGRIPEIVRARVDKMGFPTPVDDWFRGELYEPMQDLLASQSVRQRGIVRSDVVRADLERHRRGEITIGSLLFNVAQMERWWDAMQQEQPPVVAARRRASARVTSTAY
jgi:asparagine synthase (glutamine-hydrolysing)